MYMVEIAVALLHNGLVLLRQVAHHWSQVFAELGIQRFAPLLGNPHHMGRRRRYHTTDG